MSYLIDSFYSALHDARAPLLSNYNKFGTHQAIYPPLEDWLCYHCENKFVRESSLWNVDHVTDRTVDINFLDSLEA